ncbi:MAG TPA: LytR C-terminal domain-containing protein [Patescibacteria group bacterium]
MRKSRKRSIKLGEKSLSIAFFFLILVGLLISLSILLKLFLIFRAAKFDGSHQFIAEIQAPGQDELLSLDPDTNSATILSSHISTSNLGIYISVPENVVIKVPEKYDTLYSLAQSLLFHPPEGLDLNIVDRVRIFLFVNSIKPTDIYSDTWSQSNLGDDKKIIELFSDHTAYLENLSISIVNSSGESGLGNKLADYLSHIGLNIISVTSGNSILDKSAIVYSGKESYTVRRLDNILGVKSQPTQKPMLSDITLNLGKDIVSDLK